MPVRLAELMKEAGLPDGILNVVHGDKEMVDAILDHPDIKAVSFVGSSDIAQYIYSRGTANGKRVQAFGGAKNHGIVMPDADLDQVVNDLAGAAFGSAGERCMALPVVVPVGDDTADALREKLIPAIDEAARRRLDRSRGALRPGGQRGAQGAGRELHPDVRSTRARELVVDGRGFTLQGHEEGFFIGPTFFDHVKPNLQTYKEEIFGPVLQMVRADRTSRKRCACRREHEYGNGVAIFTRNGHAAREFAARVNVGMVGVNVPIPVPVAYHSFGGWKRSGFGDTNQYGMEGVTFWTKNKIVTQRWPDGEAPWRKRLRHPDLRVMRRDRQVPIKGKRKPVFAAAALERAMIRFFAPIAMIAGLMSMVACSGRDPVVADEANNLAAAPDVDVLPADESAVTPTNELENGDGGARQLTTATAIPASLHGRWGLTPADCTSTRGDAKGLLIVSADGLKFYEFAGQACRDAENVAGFRQRRLRLHRRRHDLEEV